QLLTLAALCIGLLPLSALAQVDHLRPADQRGLNVFETPKTPSAEFDGARVDWGAAFTQQFQALGHSNSAGEVLAGDGLGQTELYSACDGVNRAAAIAARIGELARGLTAIPLPAISARDPQERSVEAGLLPFAAVTSPSVSAILRALVGPAAQPGHLGS